MDENATLKEKDLNAFTDFVRANYATQVDFSNEVERQRLGKFVAGLAITAIEERRLKAPQDAYEIIRKAVSKMRTG